jgi:hypothetical protein
MDMEDSWEDYFGIITLNLVEIDLSLCEKAIEWLITIGEGEWWIAEQKEKNLLKFSSDRSFFGFLGITFDYIRLEGWFKGLMKSDKSRVNFYRLSDGAFYEILQSEKLGDQSFFKHLIKTSVDGRSVQLDSDRQEMRSKKAGDGINTTVLEFIRSCDLDGLVIGTERWEVEKRLGTPEQWITTREYFRRDNALCWVYGPLQLSFEADKLTGFVLSFREDLKRPQSLNLTDYDQFLFRSEASLKSLLSTIGLRLKKPQMADRPNKAIERFLEGRPTFCILFAGRERQKLSKIMYPYADDDIWGSKRA